MTEYGEGWLCVVVPTEQLSGKRAPSLITNIFVRDNLNQHFSAPEELKTHLLIYHSQRTQLYELTGLPDLLHTFKPKPVCALRL